MSTYDPDDDGDMQPLTRGEKIFVAVCFAALAFTIVVIAVEVFL